MTLAKHTYRPFNSIFDDLFNSVPFAGRSWQWQVPPVNIYEDKDGFELELVAPGLSKDDFKLSLEKGLLTISYESRTGEEAAGKRTHRHEFGLASFRRSFSIDDKIDTGAIQARYENGILRVALPKKEEVKALPKEISIL